MSTIINHFKELLQSENLLFYIIALVIFLLIFGRKILWSLFKFDREVAKVIHQRKSSEVRIGRIVETMSPFLADFPVDVSAHGSSTQFIGQPVDFIHFKENGEVVFIEVKSGNSKLSETQKKIKKAIEEGKVSWVDYRVR